MMPSPKSLGFTVTGLLMVLGCGGRSDSSDGYTLQTEPFATGGTTSTGMGGMGATTWSSHPMGAMPAVGGWVTAQGGWAIGGTSYGASTSRGGTSYGSTTSRGGTSNGGTTAIGSTTSRGGTSYGSTTSRGGTWNGGTTSIGSTTSRGGTSFGGTTSRGGTSFGGTTTRGGTSFGGTGIGGGYSTESCCMAHASIGCNDLAILQCVCRRDAVCCTTGWDSTCVQQVNAFGCGACAIGGAGGAGGSGNSTALGGSSAVSGGTTSATGGTLALGGTQATGGSVAVGQAMIDDLEDGNGDIIAAEGRQGYWYTFNDGTVTGTQLPVWDGRIITALALGDREGSKFVAWTSGAGFTDWGAGIGLYLKGNNAFYNANKYRGITFWAKVDPGRANVVRVGVADDQTVPLDANSFCTACWDHFSVNIILSTNWQRYSFLWSNLSQGGWGAPLATAINNSKLRSIEFRIQEAVDFGLYIDDIAFIP